MLADRTRIPFPTPRLAHVVIAAAVALMLGACALQPVGSVQPSGPVTYGPDIQIEDVYRFYRLYDETSGHPTAEQLQHYLDQGSAGLRVFAQQRRTTGARIAEAVAATPDTYVQARRCVRALPQVRERLAQAMRELGALYPQARFPPVTVAVGRGKPVGIGSPVTGVQIGLEALCATDYLNPDVEDRFVHVIAHEFIHVQQAVELTDAQQPTLLEAALMEGAAEFATEIISGNVAYAYLPALAAGREAQIESAFLAEKDSRDLSNWIGNGTAQRPGDLGYWVGYRIAKAYYLHAADKRAAFGEILRLRDAQAFLEASGWYPGMRLLATTGAVTPASGAGRIARYSGVSCEFPGAPRESGPVCARRAGWGPTALPRH